MHTKYDNDRLVKIEFFFQVFQDIFLTTIKNIIIIKCNQNMKRTKNLYYIDLQPYQVMVLI